jgi:hypothetical protein
VLLSGQVEPNTQNLLPLGRPFILRLIVNWLFGGFPYSDETVSQDLGQEAAGGRLREQGQFGPRGEHTGV